MRCSPSCVACLAIPAAVAVCAETTALQNLALGRTYTLSAPPNYVHCTDPGDTTQLTDGVRAPGRIWMHKATVGWSGSGAKTITVDLGVPQPIAGVSFSTAAGVAGVAWPADLWVFVGDDGESWHFAGGLLEMSSADTFPPAKGYAIHSFRTDRMRTRGRYVRFVAKPAADLYLFADEIEVYRGDPAWLDEPRTPGSSANVEADLAMLEFNSVLKMQLRRDLAAVRADVEDGALPAAQTQGLAEQLDLLTQRITDMPALRPEGFRAVLPATALEREIFSLQAHVWRAQGKAELRLWKGHRWDPLPPSAEPVRADEPMLEVHMMDGEYRADVLNLTNAAASDRTVRFRVEGLPGGTNPDYLQVHEVLCVGARRVPAVSAALQPAAKDGDDYTLVVPAGMTRQIWFGFHATGVSPGDYTGRITLADAVAPTRGVEVRLRVHPLRFPDETTLLFGGWSYTDGDGIRGVTPRNRLALIQHLRERFVNTPWATAAAMPLGRYDDEGDLVEEPDTSRFDEWVGRWPGARCYMVFNALAYRGTTTASFAGSKAGSALFEKKLAGWIRFWAQHMLELGLSPGQLGLLLLDEPNDRQHYEVITAYARVINRVEPEVVLWMDPQCRDDETCLEMMDAVDVLVPYRKQWLRTKDWFHTLFAEQEKQGRELGFYSCDGPSRRLDPFSYYLLQQWHCFAIGATWSHFWSFGDTSKADVWNEYATAGRGALTPLYLDDATVTGSKQMEAIREGVEDYEYLVMLREAIARADDADGAALARARTLLRTACERVLAGEVRDHYGWDEEKDRSVADKVRMEILETLSALARR